MQFSSIMFFWKKKLIIFLSTRVILYLQNSLFTFKSLCPDMLSDISHLFSIWEFCNLYLLKMRIILRSVKIKLVFFLLTDKLSFSVQKLSFCDTHSFHIHWSSNYHIRCIKYFNRTSVFLFKYFNLNLSFF